MPDKERFLRALAEFLVKDQAGMSMRMHMGLGDALTKAWYNIRTPTPLFGYPTIEEATDQLAKWLGIELKEDTRGKEETRRTEDTYLHAARGRPRRGARQANKSR